MAISSVAAISTARILSPLLVSIAKDANSAIKKRLINWSNEASQKEIAKNLLKVGVVKTIWSGGKEKHIKDFYYPSKINNLAFNEGVDHIDQLPEGNLIVQGIVGQGKSIFMRHLACTSVSSKGVVRIPVFIELQKINPLKTLMQLLYETLECLGVSVNDDSFKYLAEKGCLVFLFDGFDEVADSCINVTLNEIELLQARYPKSKIVVSSRPSNTIQSIVGFDVLHLTPLGKEDYIPFLKKLKLDILKMTALISAIESSPGSISEIISTPLMLTLVVWVYESEQEIPSTLPEFFEKLFHVVFTRHDSLKVGFTRKHFSGLSESKLLKLFEAFCFMIVQYGYSRSVTRAEFCSAFEDAVAFTDDCKCDVDDFRKDIVKVACLMLEEGLDITTFLHKSILDYYAAAFVVHSDEELSELFYTSAYTDFSQWQHVLTFLSDIDGYRYSKYFILPNFKSDAEDFIHRINEKDEKFIIEYFDENYDVYEIVFSHDLELAGWRSRSNNPSFLFRIFETSFAFDAPKYIEGLKISHSEMEEMYGGSLHGLGKNELIHVDAKNVLRKFGLEKMWSQLNVTAYKCEEIIKKAEDVVLQNKKKKNIIFGRKSK